MKKYMLRTINVSDVSPEVLKYPQLSGWPCNLDLFNIVMRLATGTEMNDIRSEESDKTLDYENEISCVAYMNKDNEKCDVFMTWGEAWEFDEEGELIDCDVIMTPKVIEFK